MRKAILLYVLCLLLTVGCAPLPPTVSAVSQESPASAASSSEAPASDEALFGLDLSTHQKDVDWEAVRDAGVQFVMLRIGYRGYGTEGFLHEDAMFASHAQGAASVGLPIGVYFHSQALSAAEAEEEARFVKERLAAYDVSFPVAFDMEFTDEALHPRTQYLTREERTEIARAFCRFIEGAGYRPMIYADEQWLSDGVDVSQLSEYPLWYAAYDGESVPENAVMIQYDNDGELPGLGSGWDLNRCYFDFTR